MNINYKIRAVQLDLARQMESMEFLKGFIDFIAENHYNTLFLYLEWRVRTKTFDIGKKDGYSAEELKEIIEYAETRGIDVIPGLAALGHAELILEQKNMKITRNCGMESRGVSKATPVMFSARPCRRRANSLNPTLPRSAEYSNRSISMSAGMRHGISGSARNARRKPRRIRESRNCIWNISSSAIRL